MFHKMIVYLIYAANFIRDIMTMGIRWNSEQSWNKKYDLLAHPWHVVCSHAFNYISGKKFILLFTVNDFSRSFFLGYLLLKRRFFSYINAFAIIFAVLKYLVNIILFLALNSAFKQKFYSILKKTPKKP